MNKLIILLVFFLFIIKIGFSQIYKKEVYFLKDDHQLTTEAQKIIIDLAQNLKNEKRQYYLTLIGHTDSDGNEDYNKNLSKKRVESVYEMFLEKGINDNFIKLDYYGEVKPVVENLNESLKSKNRRVEIYLKFIVPTDTKTEKEPPKTVRKCNYDTTIVLPKGTKITMNVCEFIDNAPCILSSKEILSLQEIRDNELTLVTTSGQHLATVGMISFADCGLKFQNDVIITMPNFNLLPDCVDSSKLRGPYLFRANQNGAWRRLSGLENQGDRLVFNVNRGGVYNCDYYVKPSFFNAQSSELIFFSRTKPIDKIIINYSCCLPVIAPLGSRAKKKRKGKKVYFKLGSCCFDSAVIVQYQFKGDRQVYEKPLSELNRKGLTKISCEKTKEPFFLKRFFSKTLIFKKYYLYPEIAEAEKF